MPKLVYPSTRQIKEIPEGTQCCQCGKEVQGEPRQTVIKLDKSRTLCLECSTRRRQAMESLGIASGL